MWTQLQQLIARVGAHFQGSRRDSELDHEIDSHLALAVEENIRKGMTRDEAMRRARVELGGVTQLREGHRETRGLPFLDTLMQDLRYTFRTLRRDAGFTTFAILIAGLGIGASATVFSVVNALMLRPLPFTDASRLAWIGNVADDGVAEWSLQVSHEQDLKEQTKSFSDMAGYFAYSKPGDNNITGEGEPMRVTGMQVSCGFFPLLGLQPIAGRQFSGDECKWNGSAAVLLSYGLWKTRYASDRSIVGRKLIINQAPVTVAGVMPEEFDFGSVFTPGQHVDLFWPFPTTAETNRWGNTLAVVGRLNPGATIEGARAEFAVLAEHIVKAHPERNSLRPTVKSLDEHVNGRFRPALMVLSCAVGVVMLIVCANLANLQMARAASRQKEMAIRVAMGAGRGRLIRQMLTESLVLALFGSVPGLLLALAGTQVFAHLDSFKIPLLNSVRVDQSALGFTAALAVLTGLAFGLVAALQAPLSAVHETLKDGTRNAGGGGKRHNWIRGALVVSEIAFACVLLVGTGLLVRSFVRVLDVNLGFQPERAAALRIDPSGKYPTAETLNAYWDAVLGAARSTPGILSAALTDTLPLSMERSWTVAARGQAAPKDKGNETFIRIVSDNYFATAGIPLIAGREFTERDTPGSEKVVIVNETLARTLWPGQNPIGQQVNQDDRRVVGVVADVRHKSIEQTAGSELYFPMRQRGDLSGVELVVRTSLPPAQLASALRASLKPIEPNLAGNEFRTLQQLVDAAVSPRWFIVLLLAGFSAFALILAALGIYALIAYSVNQRTQEFGIRMALGAGAGDLQGRVLGETLGLAAVGVGIGVVAAWFLSQTLSGLLFGVTATDPETFVAMVVLLGVVAALAGYFPARRAARVDPMVALRES